MIIMMMFMIIFLGFNYDGDTDFIDDDDLISE